MTRGAWLQRGLIGGNWPIGDGRRLAPSDAQTINPGFQDIKRKQIFAHRLTPGGRGSNLPSLFISWYLNMYLGLVGRTVITYHNLTGCVNSLFLT